MEELVLIILLWNLKSMCLFILWIMIWYLKTVFNYPDLPLVGLTDVWKLVLKCSMILILRSITMENLSKIAPHPLFLFIFFIKKGKKYSILLLKSWLRTIRMLSLLIFIWLGIILYLILRELIILGLLVFWFSLVCIKKAKTQRKTLGNILLKIFMKLFKLFLN